jgi:hypothetical protein
MSLARSSCAVSRVISQGSSALEPVIEPVSGVKAVSRRLTTAPKEPSIIAEGNISPTLSSFRNQVSPHLKSLARSAPLWDASRYDSGCLARIFVSLPLVCYLVILNSRGKP